MVISVTVSVPQTVVMMVVNSMVVTVTHVIRDTMGLYVRNFVVDVPAQIVIKMVTAKMDARLVTMEGNVTVLVLHSVMGIHVARTEVNVVHVKLDIIIIFVKLNAP